MLDNSPEYLQWVVERFPVLWFLFHKCGFAVQVESSDLISYGLIPEFIGRFPVLVSLSALNEDQLVQVIIVS